MAAGDIDIAISQYAQTTLQTVADTDGARNDFLAAIWNRADIDSLVLCVIGIFSTSSAGSWSSTGRGITATDPGLPFPAGGAYINLFSAQDVKNFRIQATAGGSLTLVATAYR